MLYHSSSLCVLGRLSGESPPNKNSANSNQETLARSNQKESDPCSGHGRCWSEAWVVSIIACISLFESTSTPHPATPLPSTHHKPVSSWKSTGSVSLFPVSSLRWPCRQGESSPLSTPRRPWVTLASVETTQSTSSPAPRSSPILSCMITSCTS